jgi:hypothetical protein
MSLPSGNHLRTAATVDSQLICSVHQLNCCWRSTAQSFLASVSSRSMTKNCILSWTCTCFEMGPPLRRKRSKSKPCYDRRSVGQSILLSTPIWGPRPNFYYSQTVASLLMLDALSDGRTDLSYTVAAGPRQRSNSGARVPRNSWPYSTASDSRLPQLRGPGPRIYIAQEHGDPVIPLGTGFPFRRLLRLAGLRRRYSNPPPRGIDEGSPVGPRYIASGQTAQKTLPTALHFCIFIHWLAIACWFIEPLPSSSLSFNYRVTIDTCLRSLIFSGTR